MTRRRHKLRSVFIWPCRCGGLETQFQDRRFLRDTAAADMKFISGEFSGKSVGGRQAGRALVGEHKSIQEKKSIWIWQSVRVSEFGWGYLSGLKIFSFLRLSVIYKK